MDYTISLDSLKNALKKFKVINTVDVTFASYLIVVFVSHVHILIKYIFFKIHASKFLLS